MQYQNHGADGDVVFITTTCLDFTPLFRTRARARAMCRHLVEVHEREKAHLHAFVVMPDHIHWIAQIGEGDTVSHLVHRVKAGVRFWLTDLTPDEEERLGRLAGLNRRTFWQRSFRSIICRDSEMIAQKVNYIHANPVRRRLVLSPDDYEFSSFKAFHFGQWTDSLRLPVSVEDFV